MRDTRPGRGKEGFGNAVAVRFLGVDKVYIIRFPLSVRDLALRDDVLVGLLCSVVLLPSEPRYGLERRVLGPLYLAVFVVYSYVA